MHIPFYMSCTPKNDIHHTSIRLTQLFSRFTLSLLFLLLSETMLTRSPGLEGGCSTSDSLHVRSVV